MLRSERGSYLFFRLYNRAITPHRFALYCLVYLSMFVLGFSSVYTRTFEGVFWQSAQAADKLEPAQSAPATLHQLAQPAVTLTGFTHEWQTADNCGPATLATNLNYYGATLNQHGIARTLRPNPTDQNVRPDELARYALEQGYGATLRVNGNADLLRLLLSNGIPVLVETWDSDDPANLAAGFAHFRLVTGYDDARQVWMVYDSYLRRDLVNPQGAYQGMLVPYARADQLWRITNRKYVVIYPAKQASLVQSILAAELDDQAMWQKSTQQARAELKAQPNDPFAWFNFGSSLHAQGLYAEAVEAFRKAGALGLPERMLWYQYEQFAAYYAAGRHQELLQLVDNELTTATGIEELYYWKAMTLVALGDPNRAHQALQQALVIKPNYRQALAALEGGLGG